MIFNFLKKKYKNLEIIGDTKHVELGKNNHFHRDVVIDVSKGGQVILGNDNHFFKGVMLMTYGGKISIGNECSFNPYTLLYGHGGLSIGNQVRVAAQSVFIPANHIFEQTSIPIYKQGISKIGIKLENDIWIGTGVKILDGCHIKTGTVVAAGAVVNSDLEQFSVYAGVPAKILKKRK